MPKKLTNLPHSDRMTLLMLNPERSSMPEYSPMRMVLATLGARLCVAVKDHTQENALNHQINRETFLKVGLAAGILVGVLSSRQASATGWIYGNSPDWQDNNWGPLDLGTAAKLGIITPDGPLQKYDRLHQYSLGQESHVAEKFRTNANAYLQRFPGTRDWAGFCHGQAHLNLGPKPYAEPVTYGSDGEYFTITYPERVVIGSVYHSDDVAYRPFLGDGPGSYSGWYVQENLDWYIDNFISNGNPFVINAPALGQIGYWYRVVVAVGADRERLLATNLNKPGQELIEISRYAVKEVYRPINWDEAKTQEVDQRLFDEISKMPFKDLWMYSEKIEDIEDADRKNHNNMERWLVEKILKGDSLSGI